MAKYTRFDPRNKKKSRDKSHQRDRVRQNEQRRISDSLFDDDYSKDYEKYGIDVVLKKLNS